jgi:glutathione S-transferase
MCVIFEKDLAGKIELSLTDPWLSPPELLQSNPFAKVPVLVTDDGVPLLESTSICEYLNGIGSGPDLMPTRGARFVQSLRKYGLGRGLIDVAFGVTIERRFGGAAGATHLAARWLEAVRRAVVHLDRDQDLLRPNSEVDIGDLALGVALGYLDFRLQEVDWRAVAPGILSWYETVVARSSMRLTAPKQ